MVKTGDPQDEVSERRMQVRTGFSTVWRVSVSRPLASIEASPTVIPAPWTRLPSRKVTPSVASWTLPVPEAALS